MPQRELATDSITQFANDLRELRLAAGDPTLATLESRTGISKSVISDAFAGRRLPTQKTVGRLVDALGGDRTQWLTRRASLDPKAGAPGRTQELPEPKSPRRMVSYRAAVLASAICTVLAVVVTSVLWTTILRPEPAEAEAPATGGEYLDYADGVDPMQTICREDAVIAASEERLDGEVLVQMMYSNQCMAVWGRITRYDGEASGNSLSMTIYPAIDMDSDRNQERSAFDVQSIYTTLMIEPDVEARVCGIASVTQGGDPIELGPPLCI